jgi:hypothetical protein
VRRASRIFHLAGIPHQIAYPAPSYQTGSWAARLHALRYDLLGQAWLAASQRFGLDPSWWAKRRTGRTPQEHSDSRASVVTPDQPMLRRRLE